MPVRGRRDPQNGHRALGALNYKCCVNWSGFDGQRLHEPPFSSDMKSRVNQRSCHLTGLMGCYGCSAVDRCLSVCCSQRLSPQLHSSLPARFDQFRETEQCRDIKLAPGGAVGLWWSGCWTTNSSSLFRGRWPSRLAVHFSGEHARCDHGRANGKIWAMRV